MTTIPALLNATPGIAARATSPEAALDDAGQVNVSPVAVADSQPVANQTTAPLSREQLEQIVSKTNAALATTTSNQLHFSVDKATGAYVIKVVDQQTGKTLHQFPNEKMLAVAEAIINMKGGSLVDQEV